MQEHITGIIEKSKNFWKWCVSWQGLLTWITAIYLLCELAFNALLLDVVGATDPQVAVDQLETYGRIISATGFTLLVWKFISFDEDEQNIFNLGKLIIIPVLVAFLAWPLVYFGQKWVVEHLVKSSSEVTRYRAQKMVLLKLGLSTGGVKLDNVSYSAKDATPTDRTFLAMVGALVFSSADYLRDVSSKQGKIIRKIVKSRIYGDFDIIYKKYQKATSKIENLYRKYRDASQKYKSVTVNSELKAQKIWGQTQEKLLEGYQKFKRAREKITKRVNNKSGQVIENLKYFLESFTSCRTQSCRKRWLDRYERGYSKYRNSSFPAEPPDWQYWCLPQSEYRNYKNELLQKKFENQNTLLGDILGKVSQAIGLLGDVHCFR